MDKEFIITLTEIYIKVNGLVMLRRAKGRCGIQTEITMRDIGKIIKNVGKVNIIFQQVINL